jgi:hypothetical protein
MLKRRSLFVIACAFLTVTAHAEPQFPDWDRVCADDQRTWGLEVRRTSTSSPSLILKIPAKLAPLFTKAELILRHRANADRINMQCGFETVPDGSKLLQVDVYDRSFDDISVVIFTDFTSADYSVRQTLIPTLPRVGDCEEEGGRKVAERFAGFTFIIPAAK